MNRSAEHILFKNRSWFRTYTFLENAYYVLNKYFLILLSLYYSNQLCSQIPRTVRYESFKNEKFERLGVAEQKVWAIQGGERRLVSTKTFNEKGFVLHADSIVYESSGEILKTIREEYEYDNLTVFQSSSVIDSNEIDTLMTQELIYNEERYLSKKITWKEYNGYFYQEKYFFDNGNLCSQVDYSVDGLPNSSYSRKFKYDSKGRLLKVFKDDLLLDEFIRDDLDRAVTIVNSGCKALLEYDLKGRLIEKINECNVLEGSGSLAPCMKSTEFYRYKRDCLANSTWFCNEVNPSSRPLKVKTNYFYRRNGLLKKWTVRADKRLSSKYQIEYELIK